MGTWPFSGDWRELLTESAHLGDHQFSKTANLLLAVALLEGASDGHQEWLQQTPGPHRLANHNCICTKPLKMFPRRKHTARHILTVTGEECYPHAIQTFSTTYVFHQAKSISYHHFISSFQKTAGANAPWSKWIGLPVCPRCVAVLKLICGVLGRPVLSKGTHPERSNGSHIQGVFLTTPPYL